MFETYENHSNKHVTIHMHGCAEIRKRGGTHKNDDGHYEPHDTYAEARQYAEQSGLRPISDCKKCMNARLLPMNRQQVTPYYRDIAELQEKYFLDALPKKQQGRFHYRKKQMKALKGTPVLFQCDNRIVAIASLQSIEEYGSPDDDAYEGAYCFDPASIRIVHGIGPEVMKKYFRGFHGFGQGAKRLSFAEFLEFQKAELDPSVAKPPFLDPADADDETYFPTCVDTRPLVFRHIKARRGQMNFRNKLRERYGDFCVVTGSRILDLLEAAHICAYRGDSDNNPENGLLLRADIHTLFDLHLIGIEPSSLRIELHPCIADEYRTQVGGTLTCRGEQRPSREALHAHYLNFTRRRCASG